MLSLFASSKLPRPETEIEQEIENVKAQIKTEKKAIQDISILVNMYENAKDIKGKKQTEKKLQELQKNLAKLQRKKKALKNELPPRPLPQPRFVQVSAVSTSNEDARAKALLPPKDLFLKAVVLWHFEATGENELSIQANQVVRVLQDFGYEEQDKEWWQVECDGLIGYVPSNYLEVISEDTQTKKAEPNLAIIDPFPVTALYDYEATKPEEISFKVGDQITVIRQDFPGWWTGQYNMTGQEGLFPVNYVEISPSSKKEEKTEQVPRPEARRSKEESNNFAKEEIETFTALAIFDYEAAFEDEMTFNQDDLISITELVMDGWYMGSKNDGQSGIVPGNYIRKLSKEEAKALHNKAAMKKRLTIPRGATGTARNDPVSKPQIPQHRYSMQVPSAQHRKEMEEEERRQYAEVFKVEKEQETASQPGLQNEPKTTDRRSNLVVEEHRESEPLLPKPKQEESSCCVIV